MITTLLALAATASPIALTRQDRQDTIYVLQGEQATIEKFRREVGDQWAGGELIENNTSQGILKYWAYSDRTAAEARALMMPAIFSGLMKGIEQYGEAVAFPAERRKLDEVAIGCGMKADPFFITPKNTVELSLAEATSPQLRTCLTKGQSELGIPLVDARERTATR